MARKRFALSLFWRTFILLGLLLTAGIVAWVQTFRALEFEPRSVQLNILSSADMARQCRSHGLRANCGGMAAWGKEFAQCIVWVDGTRLEEVLAHELRHCQEGSFHQ